jgi:rhamnulokinase
MVYNKSPRLLISKTFLMLPDYFNFLLSGKKFSEYSDATTSQLYDPIKKNWAFDLIKRLGLKTELFCKIVQPGTILGNIQEYIVEDIGITKNTKIVAPLTHDTGSAVAAAPVEMNKYSEGEWAYLSSGTWSLLGVELEKPLINGTVLKYNFTNEGGINGTIRFLKNLTGMWLIQECKRIWDNKGKDLSWKDIDNAILKAKNFQSFINPDDPAFLNPPNMIDTIQEYCRITNQTAPKSIGDICRTIIECLAFRYKQAIGYLEEIIHRKIKILHIIGGGSQNDILNQFTANAINIPVVAGPSEATAIGNILVQALALGEIDNVKELREIVKKSFPLKEYYPQNVNEWNEAYKIFLEKSKQISI